MTPQTMTAPITCPQDQLTEEYIDAVTSLRDSLGEARAIVDTRADLHPQIARAYRRFLTEIDGVVRTFESFRQEEAADIQTLQNLWHLQGIVARTKWRSDLTRDDLVG